MKYCFLLIFVSIALFACTRNSNSLRNDSPCGDKVIVDANSYQHATSFPFTITNATIKDNCLQITIGSSGCNGESWKTTLIDWGAIAKSLPPQRSIKMTLENKELCEAYFVRTFDFDIFPLRVTGTKKVLLHLDGYNKVLEYTY